MNKRNLLLKLILFVAIITLTKSTIELIDWITDNRSIAKETKETLDYKKIDKEDSNKNSEVVNPPTEEIKSDYWNFINKDFNSVDFSTLKEINPDTVAWLKINNTNINYPVVQTDNNDFYLNHSFKKEDNEAGWIFMDYRNYDFHDQNTIIYGHSRLDGSMFGSLKNVTKSSWQNNKDNHVIYISTPKENTLWQVFSTYHIETETYYIQTHFNSNEEFQEFLNELVNRSNYNYNTTLNTNDKILTLSTCYSNSKKTVLHAKLIKRQIKN